MSAHAEPAAEAGEEHKPRRRASPSWGRLIAKVYQVDPLVRTRCGKRVRVVAFVTASAPIGHILDHLGLSTPELEKLLWCTVLPFPFRTRSPTATFSARPDGRFLDR